MKNELLQNGILIIHQMHTKRLNKNDFALNPTAKRAHL